MNNSDGALDFEILLKNQQFFMNQLKQVEDGIRNIGGVATRQSEQMDSAFSKAGAALTGYFSLQAMAGFGQQLINTRGEFQKLDIAFTTMLGNKSKSDALMSEVVSLAAKTPFTLQEVAGGAKQLLAYQVGSEEVIDTLTRLGNVAAGVSVPVDRLILAYGQVKAKGKLQGDDMRQFTEAGVPIIHELSKSMGVAESSISKMVEAGQIGFPELQKVIKNLTSEGGMFYNMMEAQSKSLSGMVSNLEDSWSQALNKMGTDNQGFLEGGIGFATEVVTHFQDIIDVLKVIVASYGSYKAAVIALSLAQKAQTAYTALQTMLQQTQMLTRATQAQIIAQKALNGTMLANPYVAVAAVIGTIVSALLVFSARTKEANSAQAELSKTITSETAVLSIMFDRLKSAKQGTDEYAKARQAIIDKYGQYDSMLSTELNSIDGVTLAYNKLTESIISSAKARLRDKFIGEESDKYAANLENSYKQIRGILIKIGGKEVGSALFESIKGAFENGQDWKSLFEKGTGLKTNMGTGKQFADAIGYDLEDVKKSKLEFEQAVKEYNQIFSDSFIDDNKKQGNPIPAKTTVAQRIAEINKEIANANKELEKSRSASSTATTEDIKAIQDKISDLNKEKELLTGVKIKKEKDPSKTFDENLANIKKQYENYTLFATSADESISSIADKTFEKLLKNGASYAEYLKTLKAQYEKTPQEKRSKQQQEEYVKVVSELQEAEGGLTVEKQFSEKLKKQKEESVSLIGYLDLLKKYQEQYSGNMTPNGIAINKTIQEEINETEKEVKKQTDELVDNYTDFSNEKLKIDKQYNADVALLEKRKAEAEKAGDKKELEEAQKSLDGRKEKYEEDIDAAKESAFKKTDLYKLITDYYNSEDRKQLVNHIEYIQQALKSDELSITQRKEYEEELFKEQAELRTKDLEFYKRIANSIGTIGEQLKEVGGTLGGLGSVLSGISNQVDNVAIAFDKDASAVDKLSAGISGVVTLISMVTNASNQRKEAEQQYYNSVIAQQNEYNLALNEQIRLQAENNENIFNTDYQGRITSAWSAMTDATTKYNAALTKLSDGQVKIGKRNAIDWGNVGTGAGAGAAAGAAIGSVVPVIGTAIGAAAGAVTGAVVGLFGGKKSKDKWGSLLTEYPELVQTAANGQKTLNVELAKTLIDQGLVNDATKEELQNVVDLQQAYNEAKQQLDDTLSTLTGDLGSNLSDALLSAFENGTDAASAMFDSIEDSISNMLSQMAFAQAFQSDLTNLQKEMTESLTTGDGSVIDDFARFYSAASSDKEIYNQIMQAAKDAGSSYGFDLFNSDNTDSNSLGGSISGVSEDTASVLAGNITAIRINQAGMLESVRQSLLYQAKIARNTSYLLEIRDLIKNSDSLRAKGL